MPHLKKFATESAAFPKAYTSSPQCVPGRAAMLAGVTPLFSAFASCPTRRQVGGYFFVANGRTTDSALAVENVAFDLTSPYGYYCKVQIDLVTRSSGDDDALLESYALHSSDLLEHLLPELARVLPDWRRYESVDGRVEIDEEEASS